MVAKASFILFRETCATFRAVRLMVAIVVYTSTKEDWQDLVKRPPSMLVKNTFAFAFTMNQERRFASKTLPPRKLMPSSGSTASTNSSANLVLLSLGETLKISFWY